MVYFCTLEYIPFVPPNLINNIIGCCYSYKSVHSDWIDNWEGTNVTQVGGNGWKYPFYQKMYLGTLGNPGEGNDNHCNLPIKNNICPKIINTIDTKNWICVIKAIWCLQKNQFFKSLIFMYLMSGQKKEKWVMRFIQSLILCPC